MASKSDLDLNIRAHDHASKTIKGIQSGIIRFVGAVTASVAAVGAIAFPVRQAADFEQELKNVQKTTGFTEAQMDSLSDSLNEMSSNMVASQVQLAKIAATAGQLGLGGKGQQAIEQFTESVARATLTFGLGEEQIAAYTAQLLNIFNIDVSKTENLFSAINEVSNNSVASAGQLFDIIKRVGNTAGLTATDVTALAASTQDMGVSAEVAGTTLTKQFSNMQAKAEQFARTMGITTDEWVARVEQDALQAFKDITLRLSEMDTVARSVAVKDLFGGGRIFALATKQINDAADGFSILDRNVRHATNGFISGTSSIKEYATLSEALNAQGTELANTFRKIFIEAGNKLIPVFKDLVAELKEFADSGEAAIFMETLATGAGELVGGIAEFVKAAASMTEVWANFIPVVKIFLALGLAKFVLGAVGAIAKMALGVKKVETGWKAAAAALGKYAGLSKSQVAASGAAVSRPVAAAKAAVDNLRATRAHTAAHKENLRMLENQLSVAKQQRDQQLINTADLRKQANGTGKAAAQARRTLAANTKEHATHVRLIREKIKATHGYIAAATAATSATAATATAANFVRPADRWDKAKRSIAGASGALGLFGKVIRGIGSAIFRFFTGPLGIALSLAFAYKDEILGIFGIVEDAAEAAERAAADRERKAEAKKAKRQSAEVDQILKEGLDTSSVADGLLEGTAAAEEVANALEKTGKVLRELDVREAFETDQIDGFKDQVEENNSAIADLDKALATLKRRKEAALEGKQSSLDLILARDLTKQIADLEAERFTLSKANEELATRQRESTANILEIEKQRATAYKEDYRLAQTLANTLTEQESLLIGTQANRLDVQEKLNAALEEQEKLKARESEFTGGKGLAEYNALAQEASDKVAQLRDEYQFLAEQVDTQAEALDGEARQRAIQVLSLDRETLAVLDLNDARHESTRIDQAKRFDQDRRALSGLAKEAIQARAEFLAFEDMAEPIRNVGKTVKGMADNLASSVASALKNIGGAISDALDSRKDAKDSLELERRLKKNFELSDLRHRSERSIARLEKKAADSKARGLDAAARYYDEQIKKQREITSLKEAEIKAEEEMKILQERGSNVQAEQKAAQARITRIQSEINLFRKAASERTRNINEQVAELKKQGGQEEAIAALRKEERDAATQDAVNLSKRRDELLKEVEVVDALGESLKEVFRKQVELGNTPTVDLSGNKSLSLSDEEFNTLADAFQESSEGMVEFRADIVKQAEGLANDIEPILKTTSEVLAKAFQAKEAKIAATAYGEYGTRVKELVKSIAELREKAEDAPVHVKVQLAQEAAPLISELDELIKSIQGDEGLKKLRIEVQPIADQLKAALGEQDPITLRLNKAAQRAELKKTLDGTEVDVTLNVTDIKGEGSISFPEARGLATGGPVFGAGGPTSDSIPAWLSNGEYVIKAAAVQKYGIGMFDALNSMRMSRVPRFANGGPVNVPSAAPTDSMELVVNLGGNRFALNGSRDQVRGFAQALKDIEGLT